MTVRRFVGRRSAETPLSKRALMKREGCLNTTTILKVLQGLPENLTSQAFHQAHCFPVTKCGSHTFAAL